MDAEWVAVQAMVEVAGTFAHSAAAHLRKIVVTVTAYDLMTPSGKSIRAHSITQQQQQELVVVVEVNC